MCKCNRWRSFTICGPPGQNQHYCLYIGDSSAVIYVIIYSNLTSVLYFGLVKNHICGVANMKVSVSSWLFLETLMVKLWWNQSIPDLRDGIKVWNLTCQRVKKYKNQGYLSNQQYLTKILANHWWQSNKLPSHD